MSPVLDYCGGIVSLPKHPRRFILLSLINHTSNDTILNMR